MFVSYENSQGVLTVRNDIVNFRVFENSIQLETKKGGHIHCDTVSFSIDPHTIKRELFTKKVINLMGK